MNKVALVIIYNHQYNKNIEILEYIYKERFSSIYHLVPFYNGVKDNVIPVYENSYYFQGYIAQGLKSFFKKDYNHYFFIADDLILNPIINEKNYKTHLNLTENSCFLPEFISLNKIVNFWPRVVEAFRYTINIAGVEAKNQLPNYDVALASFKKFELEIKPLVFSQLWKTPSSIKDISKIIIRDKVYLFRYLLSKTGKKKYNLSYPIVGGYSDIFVVSSDAIKQFCHYCGVFATTKLFVEFGIPTALVLSAEKIVLEKELKLQGKALWTKEDYSILKKHENQLENLLNDFPLNHLYIHAIKLSKWKTNYEKSDCNNINF